MKKAFEIPNYRAIRATFVSPTNTRGARVKIYETKRYNDEKTQSKIFPYSYEIGDVMEQAHEILTRNGFNVIGRASDIDNYIFFCDNWGDDFKEIKDLN